MDVVSCAAASEGQGVKGMVVIIDGARFDEADFYIAMDLVRQQDPVMADAIEGMVMFEDE